MQQNSHFTRDKSVQKKVDGMSKLIGFQSLIFENIKIFINFTGLALGKRPTRARFQKLGAERFFLP
jgi:hypothetical protein